jgi:peptide-methionine (S)-S-oxide reductase
MYTQLNHFINGQSIMPPFPKHCVRAVFGMGCFWGAERKFWELEGAHVTAVCYTGGEGADPTYEMVCSGRTGHAEVVLVIYQPEVLSYSRLLTVFWEGHNPTQGMRQGNDTGTQYRSLIQTHSDEQRDLAQSSLAVYQDALGKDHPQITTEIRPATDFYYAEDYHQQYLAKNPGGYCGLGGTGVSYPATV